MGQSLDFHCNQHQILCYKALSVKKKKKKGFELIDSLPDSDAIVITKDKKIILSKSMADSFELKNTEFTIEYRD